MSRHPVVVGVDGSQAALQAVRWAALAADRRGTALRLVHVYQLPFPYLTDVIGQESIRDLLHEQGQRWLDNAAATAEVTVPGLRTEVVAADAPAIETLIKESAAASLMVLGTRGLGGFTGLLVGSTSVALAGRAHCPLVVVRDTDDAATGGPVVVGVDGTPIGEAAIAFAFEEASAREAELVAVHSWTEPAVENALVAGALAMDYGLLEEQATVLLAERMAGWQEKYPEVRVTRQVVRDHSTRALLRHAGGAQLVVVGSRGRGGSSAWCSGRRASTCCTTRPARSPSCARSMPTTPPDHGKVFR